MHIIIKKSIVRLSGVLKQAGEHAMKKPDKHKAYHNMGNVFMKQKAI